MSPAGLAKVFAALAVLVLAIGVGFAMAGAWLILPFAGLEVLLLGAAFVMYGRHAADYERVEIELGRPGVEMRVEVAEAERITRYRLDDARVSLEEGRVVLRGAREELEIGRHLGPEGRAGLAAELQARLIRGTGT